MRRDVVSLGLGNIAIVLSQLGFRGVLLASLTPVNYGRLSLILSVYNTLWIIGASGLPNSVARFIAVASPKADRSIVRAAVCAGVIPTALATVIVSTISAILLHSIAAGFLATTGLSSLVYSLLAMGILRGRGHMGLAIGVMLAAAVAEVVPLLTLWFSHAEITTLSAFAVFCFGNIVGLVIGIALVIRTAPGSSTTAGLGLPFEGELDESVPSPRELLAFSTWLGTAVLGMTALPLVMRAAAALDSYTTVAVIDVALVLLSIPQRIGTIMVSAVVPHASRTLKTTNGSVAITRREQLLAIAPFLLAASIVAFTPLARVVFDALGRPLYARDSDYFALALLAGPARILYGLVEGMLIAYGDGRYLALSTLGVATIASGMMLVACLFGEIFTAFGIFVLAFWGIYLLTFRRLNTLSRSAPADLLGRN